MIASRDEAEGDSCPSICYACEGAPGVCLGPAAMLAKVLSIEQEVETLHALEKELCAINSDDGTTEGHHKSFLVYCESIRLGQQTNSVSINHCHLFAVACMRESTRQHQKHTAGVFELLESLNRKEVKVGDEDRTCRICRFVDGAELVKDCGTSTFGSRAPCPCCPRTMAALQPASSLGECEEDRRGVHEDPDCDHDSDGCVCNKHCN